jgi:hypothetical protein
MSNDMATAAGTVSGGLPRRTSLAESAWSARGNDISAAPQPMPDWPARVARQSASLFGVGESGAFGQECYDGERHGPEGLA